MDDVSTFGPYELLGKISTGGMAEVYRARDTRSGALVALKRILPSVAADEEFVTMFLDEARIASELEHPHIARVLDYKHEGGEHSYIAYELVEGKDLRAIASRGNDGAGPLPLPFLLYVFCRVAEGLAYAHARKDAAGEPKSIVHRDVSPQNIVVSFDGDVKLIDFGIAKAKGKVSRTATGTLKGKLGYMSPEQVRGSGVDQRTDVFSLGICMWELLTLKRLFTGPNEILVLDMVKRHVPDPPSAMRADLAASPWGGELDRIVMKALAKERDERYRSARELSKDLYVFVEKSGAVAKRADVAYAMEGIFGTRDGDEGLPRSLGRNVLQETQRMSDENKGGSDLDIFEGLGKKSSGRTSAAPPPPPGSGANLQAAKPAAAEMKKTLLGIPGPAPMPQSEPSKPPPPPPPASGSMRAAAPANPSQPPAPAASKPPPPPGRGSLPAIQAGSPSQPPMQAASPSTTQKVASAAPPPAPPPPASTRPTALANTPSSKSMPAATPSAKLDMDWDDDDEATHVFDKDKKDEERAAAADKRREERADLDAVLSAPPPARLSQPPVPAAGSAPPPPVVPPAPATLSGAFGALGQPQQTNGQATSASFRSSPPASQSMRSAPPPPPPTSQRMQTPPPPPHGSVPPPPPPGQTTTAPMHMPPTARSVPPGAQTMPSSPPAAGPVSHPPQMTSQPPQMQMPPVGRNMEATAMVPRPQPSKSGPMVALLLGVCAAVALAVFFLIPRTGTVVINVADAKGGAVSRLEILVDGTKKCESAPCIVKDMSAGVHEVKVVAQGFDPPAPRAITVEARKDSTSDFTLVASKNASGTGLKVAGNQPGVKLWVDGKEIGPLPQEVKDLEPGEHKLHLGQNADFDAKRDRYQPLDKTVSVGKDEIVDVGAVALKVLKGKAMIQLGTPGAKVYLVSGTNRKEVPQFPIAIDFDPNEKWQLEAKLPGYDDFVQPITFDDGQAEKTYTVTLSPKGTSAAQPQQPRAAQPVVAAPASEPKKASEPTAAAEPKAEPKKAEPAAAGGESFLNINSLPASTVVLDGKPLGPTPKLKVSVSPGAHTILFINAEQSLKKSISVNVGAGETKAAFAKLRD